MEKSQNLGKEGGMGTLGRKGYGGKDVRSRLFKTGFPQQVLQGTFPPLHPPCTPPLKFPWHKTDKLYGYWVQKLSSPNYGESHDTSMDKHYYIATKCRCRGL